MRYDPATLARRLVDLLSEKQASDIVLLDISPVATFADYFLIATGDSKRQIEAILAALEEELGREQLAPLGREGEPESGWVLLDLGDIVVHIFGPEERSYYDLEGLWHRARPVVRVQ
ncbi:MAG TPA: ribosome silencing factor [Dehalococcoidia bacterium]|nr:ribosome silencing factor [Dehalococcoidia bacterium]